MPVETELVAIESPDALNVILGQTHFIKTAEDVHEALVGSVPGIKFGVAFCEASGPALVRVEGNDDGLKKLAAKNALSVGAGHFFVVFMKDAYPINVLRALRDVPSRIRNRATPTAGASPASARRGSSTPAGPAVRRRIRSTRMRCGGCPGCAARRSSSWPTFAMHRGRTRSKSVIPIRSAARSTVG